MAKWSNKDERQYKHIKKSVKQRGKSEDTAEEIAARTVNKQRRKKAGRRTKPPKEPAIPTNPSRIARWMNCGISHRNSISAVEAR